MPSLPIPLISALILCFLMVHFWIMGRRHLPLMTLLALCALQGIVISLAQHYHVSGFLLLQPLSATVVPPMAWLAFQSSAVRTLQRGDVVHVAGPGAALISLILYPAFLDVLIPALFGLYGFAVLWFAGRGADGTPLLRLEAGDLPGKIWQLIGLALIASAFSDLLIVAAHGMGMAHLQPWIISISSGLMLLVVGGLSVTAGQGVVSDAEDAERTPLHPVSDEDTKIVGQLDELMDDHALYLNPDLTLSQLARRMRMPSKQLSRAINRVSGQNMSRYVNARRIKAAQAALLEGQTVTQAMLTCGFNTKSNFNREFLRVVGQSPSAWLLGRSA